VRTLRLPRGHTYAVAYAPDGRLLACGDSYGAVRFWDLADFTERFVFEPKGTTKVWGVAFSPAGDRLIAEHRLFDVTPAAAALRRPAGGAGPESLALPEVLLQEVPAGRNQGGAYSLVFSPDGQVVGRFGAILPTAGLKQWDRQGNCRRTVNVPGGGPNPLAFSADGRSLAAGGFEATLSLWDWAAGVEVARLKHTDRVHDAAFTPDGRLLATAAGRIVRLWDWSTGECVARFPAFRGRSFGLALHPRGRLLAAGSMDGTVRLWDVVAAREAERYDWQVGAIRSVAFSPDGMTAAAAGHKKAIVIWDVGDLAG
jgi:WD40 repeat protein